MESKSALENRKRQCLAALEQAQTDSEYLACFAGIPHLIGDLDDGSFLTQLAERIPDDFIIRLIADNEQYAEIGIAVLSKLLQEPSLIAAEKFINCIPFIMKIANDASSSIDSLETKQNLCMDCLHCIRGFFSNKSSKAEVMSNEFFAQILRNVAEKNWSTLLALQIMAANDYEIQASIPVDDLLAACVPNVLKLTTPTSGEEALELLVLIVENIDKNSELFDYSKMPKWGEFLRILCRSIMQDRKTVSQWRMDDWSLQRALQLFSICGNIFDYRWLESDPEFVEIVAHLASIELQSILGSENFNFTNPKHLLIVSSCSAILEKYSVWISDEEICKEKLHLSPTQQERISRILVESGNYLCQFFVAIENGTREVPPTIVYPLYRLICALLCDGCDLFEESLKPSVSVIFKLGSSALTNQAEFDAIGLILPALSHIVVKPPLLESLLAVDFLSILIEYLKQLWTTWLRSKDNQDSLLAVITVLLNVCNDEKLATRLQKHGSNSWKDLLNFFARVSKSMELRTNTAVLVIHMVLLSVILCRYFTGDLSEYEPLLVDCMQCLRVLAADAVDQFVDETLPQESREILVQCWQASMNHLIGCVPKYPRLVRIIEESGWLGYMLTKLTADISNGSEDSQNCLRLYSELLKECQQFE